MGNFCVSSNLANGVRGEGLAGSGVVVVVVGGAGRGRECVCVHVRGGRERVMHFFLLPARQLWSKGLRGPASLALL